MTTSHRIITLCCTTSAAAVLSGCLATRPQQFANSFLPAAPATTFAEVEQPPRITPNLYGGEKPQLTGPIIRAAEQSDAEARVRRAEAAFEAGKRLYQQGDVKAARVQFDQAVDALLNAPLDMPDRTHLERTLENLTEHISRYDLDAENEGDEEAVVYEKSPLDSGILDMTFPTDPNLKPKVGEELQATISQLPLDANDAVLSYIHYFETDRGRRTLMNGLRRSGRYREMVRRVLDEEGIPQELLYLAQAESGFTPYAMSNKKAVGMWQFAQWRGHEYGLGQTAYSDDRLDPEKATRAAARHLRDLYHQFGDWYLAMAAYNCGPNCVEHAVERTGFADFWQLRSLNALPRETQNYVPLILAITIMAKNPNDYGLGDLDSDQPMQYDAVPVEAPTSLWLVADACDDSLSEIRELNPALLRPFAPAGYELRVPRGTGAAVRAALGRVPAQDRMSWRLHRISEGESLARIGRQYQTSVEAISSANDLVAARTTPGDLLLIPATVRADRSARTTRVRRSSGTHRRATARLAHSSTRRARS